MRALVFLLIVANLLFLAWERGYFGASFGADSAGAGRPQQEILADQVNIVSRDEPPVADAISGRPPAAPSPPPTVSAPPESPERQETSATPANPEPGQPAQATQAEKAEQAESPEKPEKPEKTARAESSPKPPDKPAPLVCLALSDLTSAELPRVTEMVRTRFPEFRMERKSFAGSKTYWVFIPPMANRQEAERRSEELKKLNVPEFFILQEPPAMRFAISLGVFSTREAAVERLADLRAKGVKAAQVGERETRPVSYLVELQGPERRANALRQAIAGALPKTRVATCKAR